jgi:putative ABC transport system permease protein
MIRNYFVTILRNLRKNPVFATINIAGLSLGMAAFIFIFQYVSFEQSVDAFHANRTNIYRVLYETDVSGKPATWAVTPPRIGTLAKETFQEVADYCRVMDGVGNGVIATPDDKFFREEHVAYVEENFFRTFTFTTIKGNADAIKEPNTVALAQSAAKRFFGEQDPIGKTITMNNQFGSRLFTVTSVYEDFPENSDFDFSICLSINTLANPANLNGNNWARLDNINSQFLSTFLVLHAGADHKELESKLNVEKKKRLPDDAQILVRLQRMENMHLAESLGDYYSTSGSLAFIYILEGIAALILVIAWFNYINLSTAGALKRAKEVGLRKAIGATRRQLVWQFLGESLFINILSLGVALALVNIFQPIYNSIVSQELSMQILNEGAMWATGAAAILIGSLASGSYSAFVLSSFKPSQILKGVFAKSTAGIFMRKSLVVFQFSISVLLIASTLILYRQLDFMNNSELGVSLEQLVTIREPEVGRDSTFRTRAMAFRHEVGTQSFVQDYSMSGTVPGRWYNYNSVGYTTLNPQPGDEKTTYSITFIDERYLNLFDIQLAAGKNFTPQMCERPWGQVDRVIINESAARALGFESPQDAVGKKVTNAFEAKKFGGDVYEYEVVGVVKDYHHLSLQQEINPVLFFPMYNSNNFTVKLTTEELSDKLAKLEAMYKASFPGNPFEYFFVDEVYDQQYKSERQYGSVFSIASGLAIFIACLGLFGLATFTVEQRRKEVGIRKVLGANASQITRLFSKDFLTLVIISIVIATPISWYVMDQWLQEFAYRTQIVWWVFGVAGLMAIAIALVTVSSQAIKAALANPVDALRDA